MGETDQPVVNPFWTSPLFGKAQVAFWTAFILLPFFTGWLAYDWLPNESFNEEKHLLLESHDVSDGNGHFGDKADKWQDKRTGKVYSRTDFAEHRRWEAKRMTIAWFAYGLAGCFFFAWVRFVQKKDWFYAAFGKAMLVNLAVATIMWIQRWASMDR